jgi:hypothetical protein
MKHVACMGEIRNIYIKLSEMRLLRSVAGYRITDKKRSTDIRQELNILVYQPK